MLRGFWEQGCGRKPILIVLPKLVKAILKILPLSVSSGRKQVRGESPQNNGNLNGVWLSSLMSGTSWIWILIPIWNKPGYLGAEEEFFKKFGHSFDAEFYGGSIGDGFRAIKQLFPDEKHE